MKTTPPLLLATIVSVALLAGLAKAEAPAAVSRPADVSPWITLGVTLHANAPGDHQPPDQLRHVQIEPGAYAQFLKDGAFPDGTTFAVTFHGLKTDGAGASRLFVEDGEQFFGLEILDAHHPDGRRFYAYMPGKTSAQALPAGNSCAVCHNANGARQGTFTQYYPTIAAKQHGAH